MTSESHTDFVGNVGTRGVLLCRLYSPTKTGRSEFRSVLVMPPPPGLSLL